MPFRLSVNNEPAGENDGVAEQETGRG
jgi:hypothetical protein